jgi:hypothetical protein
MLVLLRRHDAPPSLCVRSVYGGGHVAVLRQNREKPETCLILAEGLIRSGTCAVGENLTTWLEELSQWGSSLGLVDLGRAMAFAFRAAQMLRQVDDQELLSEAACEHSREQQRQMATSALLLAMRSPSVRRARSCRA